MKTGYKILIAVFIIIFVSSLVGNYIQYRFGKLPEKVEDLDISFDADLVEINDDKIVESTIVVSDENKKVEVITKIVERIPEGYVKLNLSEYRKNMAALSNFKKRYEELFSQHKATFKIEVGESEVVKDDLVKDPVTKESIEELMQLLTTIDTTATISLQYQTAGFIFRPSWGVGYCDGLDFTVGIKTFFWNKYNAGFYATTNLGGIGVGRHLNDIVKVFKNTELRAIGGIGYKGGFRFWVGLTTDM